MNEYSVRLTNGQLRTVYAHTKTDIRTTLEAAGIDRGFIKGIRLLERNAPSAVGNQAYLETDQLTIEQRMAA